METIGDRIRTKRKELNLTQVDLAARLNITDRAVSKWEQNEGNPDFGILPSLADTLGVSLDFLITGRIDEPQINLEDMDATKRALLLVEKDDVENFVKYGYVSETILYDGTTKARLIRDNAEFVAEENIREAVYQYHSEKIFNLLLDAFLRLDLCNSKNMLANEISPASLVYDNIDDFLLMCTKCGRRDAFEQLGVKWFALGTPRMAQSNNRFNIQQFIRPSEISTDKRKSTYMIRQETFSSFFENDVSEDIVDYFCNISFFETIDFQFNRCQRICFLIDNIVTELYRTHRFDRIDSVLKVLNDNLLQCHQKWKSRSQDSGFRFAGSCLQISEYGRSCILGVVPTISVDACLLSKDLKWLERFNEYNKQRSILFGDGKTGFMGEEDIKAFIIQNDPSSSDDDKLIAERTRYRLLNYNRCFPSIKNENDIDELKRASALAKHRFDHVILKGYIHYMEMVEDCISQKNYRVLFEFSHDYELKDLEEAVLSLDNEQITVVAKKLFLPPKDVIAEIKEKEKSISYIQNDTHRDKFSKANDIRRIEEQLSHTLYEYIQSVRGQKTILSDMIERQAAILPIREATKVMDGGFLEYCSQVKRNEYEKYQSDIESKIESITHEKAIKEEYDKVSSEITIEYLNNEAQKDNIENAVIKLCVLLEAKLKFLFKYNGDLFTMLDQYISDHLKEEWLSGWDDENQEYRYQDDKMRLSNIERKNKSALLHKLRMKRNQLVHSNGEEVDFTQSDLQSCISIVENL